MTDDLRFDPYQPMLLPDAVSRYLVARHVEEDRGAAATVFAPDARVVDEDTLHVGIDAVRGWLASAGSEYTYTTTFVGQAALDADQWVVLTRLEGDFPGGVADLRFRFRVEGEQIAELVIAP